MRLCTWCKKYLDESSFYPSSKVRCKECTKLSQRNTYSKDPIHHWYKKQISSKKSECIRREIPFDLDLNFLKSLPTKCYYCDKPLEIDVRNMTGKPVQIDKVIPKLGYIKTNVVLSCSVCNLMKQNNDLESLERFIKKIKEFLKLT